MRRQIRGLSQGSDNIKDGMSLVQVADGALDEVTSCLQRINELSIKAYNGTNEEEDREYIPPCMRNEGATLKRQFQRAINLGAKIILLISWNEWVCSEQISVEQSKDLEPSKIHGTFYYDIMKKEIKKFKRKK